MMPNKYFTRSSIAMLFVVILLVSCDRSEVSEIRGYVIGADKSNLIRVDFTEFPPRVTRLVDDPDLLVRHVSKYDTENFFYQACRKSEDVCKIYKYNLDRDSSEIIREGNVPVCVKKHKKMFFYKRYEGDTFFLVISNCDDSGSVEKLFKTKHRGLLGEGDTQPAVVQIGADEILYRDQQTGLLTRYLIRESRSISTGIVGCIPVAWRSKTKQVLCRSVGTAKEYVGNYLLNLETGSEEVIPENPRLGGAVYLVESDAVIHRRTGYRFPIGERYDTFLYYFESGVNVRIVEHVSMRSAIWLSEDVESETKF